ncbi:hypothetical protein NP493_274g01008 [Ridgeia piscesae]|uniref:G-protein coupled receptors family 1 profile domain-containing protein n=1 Tax=Ridgeia piscesae TaxID=27915 RepID=A0AAD9NXJ6_RIDPI|nr:hypothetical protein NP493_274g01008 [Ridgeia piscesae]
MTTRHQVMIVTMTIALVTAVGANDTPTPTNMSNTTEGNSSSTVPCGIFFFIIYGPLYGLVCAFGLIGNSLSFAVLHKYTCGNVGTYLLKALALMDNLFLVTAAVVQMYLAMSMYFNLHEQLEAIYPTVQTFGWPLAHIIQMCTVWMMVLVAGNRYFAVCRPLDAPRLCTKHNVQLEIMVMASAVCVYNIPRFFEYRSLTHNVTTVDENNVTSNLLITMNSSLNFVIYCLFRRQFQHQLCMLFGRRCGRPLPLRNYSQTESLSMHIRGYGHESVRSTSLLRTTENLNDSCPSHLHSGRNNHCNYV